MSTKWQSYQDVLRSGQAVTQAERVLQIINYAEEGITRSEIAEASGMRLSSVCARASELLASEVVYIGPTRRCAITGKNVETLKVVNYAL